MNAETHADITEIRVLLDDIEKLSIDAEETLRLLGADDCTLDVHEVLQTYEELRTRNDNTHASLSELEAKALPPFEKSELTYARGRHKRLQLVIKNIVRICRTRLGIVDLERVQEEVSLRLNLDKFE